MARLGAFFRQQPWWHLVPDLGDRLVTAGGGDGAAKVTAAYTPDWTRALLYISADGQGPRTITLNLSSFPGPVTARWFNPAKDALLVPHTAALPNRSHQILSTPDDNGTGVND